MKLAPTARGRAGNRDLERRARARAREIAGPIPSVRVDGASSAINLDMSLPRVRRARHVMRSGGRLQASVLAAPVVAEKTQQFAAPRRRPIPAHRHSNSRHQSSAIGSAVGQANGCLAARAQAERGSDILSTSSEPARLLCCGRHRYSGCLNSTSELWNACIYSERTREAQQAVIQLLRACELIAVGSVLAPRSTTAPQDRVRLDHGSSLQSGQCGLPLLPGRPVADIILFLLLITVSHPGTAPAVSPLPRTCAYSPPSQTMTRTSPSYRPRSQPDRRACSRSGSARGEPTPSSSRTDSASGSCTRCCGGSACWEARPMPAGRLGRWAQRRSC